MINNIINKIGRQLLGNSIWLLVEKLTKLIVGLYVGVSVARYLGPENMGTWNLGLAIFAFFSILSSLGLDYVTPRELLLRKNSQSSTLSNVLIIKLLGSSLGFVIPVVYVAIANGYENQTSKMILILSTGYFFQIFDVIEYYFQAYLKSSRTVITRLCAFLVVSVYKLYLIHVSASFIWFVASSTFEFMIGAILLIGSWYNFKNKIDLGQPSKQGMLALLKDSLPFSLASILAVLHFRIDQVMITELLNETQNGIYSVAIRIFELILFLLAVIVPSYMPTLSESYTSGKASFSKTLIQFYTFVTWLSIFSFLVTFVVAKPIMLLLYGEAFNGSGSVLQLLSFGLYPMFMGIAISNYLIITNQKKFNLFRSLVGLLFNVIFNFWLIPIWGIQGAAISSIISNFLSTFIIVFSANKHNHLKLFLAAFQIKRLFRANKL